VKDPFKDVKAGVVLGGENKEKVKKIRKGNR